MEKETSRVEAFSDGVFAIALTLLVLGIKVPETAGTFTNETLYLALLKLWPSLFAFVLSFFTVLIMWINHHGFFKYLKKITPAFLYANGFLLLMVTFINFPTYVLANSLNTPAINTAAAFYCGTIVLVNVAYNLLWFTSAYRRRLLRDEVSDALIFKIRNAYLVSFGIYLAAFAVSFYFPLTGLLICISLWVLWLFLDYEKKVKSK